MEKQDFRRFAEKWADAHEAMAGGRIFSQRAMTIVFDALEDYSLEAVFKAVKIHTKKGKFAPVPNDIIEIIIGNTGQKHIGADEAWGLVMDIYQTGDVTGARMAFRDAYNRIISTASNPSWFVSSGFDAVRRVDVVQKAISLGRLPASAVSKYYIEAPTTTVAGLIESASEKASKSSDQEFKEKAKKVFQGIRAVLSTPGRRWYYAS